MYRLFRRRKGRKARVVQDQQLGCLDLDLAGRHPGVDGLSRAQPHLAYRGHNVLRPHLFALGVAVRRQFLVQYNLADAAAVAQIEKDQVAVIAPPVDPAHEYDSLSSLRDAKIAAVMRPFEIT